MFGFPSNISLKDKNLSNCIRCRFNQLLPLTFANYCILILNEFVRDNKQLILRYANACGLN
jgi:hypothetical protein